METDATRRHETVRRRAVANLVLLLSDEAQRSDGRFGVTPLQQDVIGLEYHGVRTLVRRGETLQFGARHFAVVLACPPAWPFDRNAPLLPFILAPDDFAHPNSDGHAICVDLAGVLPERIPGLLYDNLRLQRFRLDHPVDHAVAAFVRAHLDQFPADSRPLCAEPLSADVCASCADFPLPPGEAR